MKKAIFQKIGAMILVMAISLSLVSPCVSYAVEEGCPLPEHQHTSECYVLPSSRRLDCGVTAHRHGPECYDENMNIVCGYSDKVIHRHDTNCYDADGTLVCNLPEYEAHAHTADCYQETRVLVCQEDTANIIPHVHTDECYEEQRLCICGQENDEEHIHTDECYQTNRVLVCTKNDSVQAHIHTDACYETKLTCVCGQNDLVPHSHTDMCRNMNGEYVCGLLETMEHQHDDSCFVEEGGGMSEEPLCGMQEHTHTEACQPGQDNKPSQDEPSADEPSADDSEDLPSDEASITDLTPVNFVPVVQFNVGSSAMLGTFEQISGPASIEERIRFSVSASGLYSIASLSFKEVGTYVFRISCDSKEKYFDMTVNVTEFNGSLSCAVSYIQMPDGMPITGRPRFNGTDTLDPVSFAPAVTKKIIGEVSSFNSYYRIEMESGDSASVVMPASTICEINMAETWHFDPISITSAGLYRFVIKQVSKSGMELYSGQEWVLNVSVTEVNGALQASCSYVSWKDGTKNATSAIFEEKAVQFIPYIERIVTGEQHLTEKKYTVLKHDNCDTKWIPGYPFDNITIAEAGRHPLSSIIITHTGIYNFFVGEIVGNSMTSKRYVLTITVTEDVNGDLQASGIYKSDIDGSENTTAAIFKEVNCQFTPIVDINFIGEHRGSTSYTLSQKKASNDVQISEPKTVTWKEGRVSLDPISFEMPGTYEFEISANSEQMRTDTRPYTLTVTVTEEGDTLQASGVYSVDGGLNRNPNECATFIFVEENSYKFKTSTEVKAKRLMNQMTLEEKVGQLFLLHYSDSAVRTADDVKKITDKYHPGGYIVFQPDLKNETPTSFRKKIDQTQKDSKIPLIISIDEEGGKVNRASNLTQFRTTPFLGPQDLKKNGGLSAVRSDASDKAAFLENLGINLNHAPVADVADAGYIYARTWGGDGLDNADYVANAVEGMEGAGMGTTLKHFPGYGSTSSDTHNGFAVNYLSENDFKYNDLLPFYSGMIAGTKSVMVTHNTINYLDPNNPASLSPAVYNMLRNEIGFEGLVITDDLNMNAVTNFVGDGKQSLAALKAGADMALVPYPDKQIPTVLAAAKSGDLPASRIEESCFRVLCWKIEHGLLDDISDFHENTVDTSIPVKIIIDGVPMQIGEITQAYLENKSSGSVNYRISLTELADFLSEYDVDMDHYVGSLVFGTQSFLNGNLVFTQGSINKEDGEWFLSLPENANLKNLSIFYSSKAMTAGEYDVDEISDICGFFSVRVNDVAAELNPDTYANVSSVQYVAAGNSLDLRLPFRNNPITWIVNKGETSSFLYTRKIVDKEVLMQISQIYSPVVIVSGSANNVTYTVQYYADLEVIDKSGVGAAAYSLDIINTAGGRLPKNGNLNLPTLKLTLNADGTVKKNSAFKKIFLEENFSFLNASTLAQTDKVLTSDAHYSPKEIWVLKDGCSSDSLNRDDWDIYNKEDLGLSSLYDLQLTNIDETTDSSTTIFITNGAVIRFIYDPSAGTAETPVDFWDYDITDGYIYSDENLSVRKNTSSQSNSQTAYVKTWRQGINSPDNYSGEGSRFSFGNANTGSGWHLQQLDGMYFNQFNRFNGTAQSYKGCFFGLPVRLDSDGIVFRQGVSVPDLFGETKLTGKTAVSGKTLQFVREGDTYTLEAVGGTDTKNLSSFRHPSTWSIWTNDFWPMDSSNTFGADGHDLIFGRKDITAQRKCKNYPQTAMTPSEWNSLPVSDDLLDHNSYFGMHFTVDFTLPAGYCGDLEYLFFGDDDIWMFLDGKLVLDIGGCHSSVGEYVNLWDYIPQGDTSHHELQFFYLERGASGSTCWIQYTIPSAKIVSGGIDAEGDLKIEKHVITDSEDSQSFDFTILLKDEYGKAISDNIPCMVYSKDGTTLDGMILNSGEGHFTLSDKDYVIISRLPANCTYSIIEDEYDCNTYVEIGDPKINPPGPIEEPDEPGDEIIEEGEEVEEDPIESEEVGGDTSEEEEVGGDISEGEEVGGEVSEGGEGGGDISEGGAVGPYIPNIPQSRVISGTVGEGESVKINFYNVFASTTELPETGGPGILTLTFTSLTLITMGIGLVWIRKKSRSCI